MGLPTSGNLSIKDAAGLTRSIAEEVDGDIVGNKALYALGVTAGMDGDGQVAMTEFYGYTSTQQIPTPVITSFIINDTRFWVDWDAVTAPGASIQYNWSYTGSNGSSSTGTVVNGNSGSGNTTALDINAIETSVFNMDFTFTLYAVDTSGSGSWTDSENATEVRQTYAADPYNLQDTSRTSSSITWDWNDMEGSGQTVSYNWVIVSGGSDSGTTTNSTITVSGLNSSTAYTILIKSVNTIGSQSNGVTDSATTDPPPNVTVNWKQPVKNSGTATLVLTEYSIDGGSTWPDFSGTTALTRTTGTVAYRFTINFSSGGGYNWRCGTTDGGGTTLGSGGSSYPTSGQGTLTSNNITVDGNNSTTMWFTGDWSGD